MKKIKAYKTFNIIALIFALLGAILIAGVFLKQVIFGDSKTGSSGIYFGIFFYIVLMALQIPGYIITCLNSGLTEESVSKHNMVMKLLYIPFFVLNFISVVLCLVEQDLGTVIALVAFLIILSGIVMFRTSLSNIIYFVKSYSRKSLKSTPWSIIAIIMLCIFCLDVPGSIILYVHERNQNPELAAIINGKKHNKITEMQKDWKNKRHMSLTLYTILSAIGSLALYIGAGGLAYDTYAMIVGSSLEGLPPVDLILNVSESSLFISCLGIVCAGIIFKTIVGIIYGKHGEKNPLNVVIVMKFVDLIPTLVLFAISAIFVLVGFATTLFAMFLMLFLVVVVMIFVVMAFFLSSFAAYALSSFVSTVALFTVLGNTLTVFSYYMKQRQLKNSKFASKKVVACMVLLWIPLLNIPALFILKNIDKNDNIFGDIPLVKLD